VLLPFIEKHCEVELFHNNFDEYRGYETHHYLRAFERHREKPFTHFFYQIEDGPASHFCRFHSTLIPGISWFHDLLVVDSGPVPLYVSPWEKTLQKFFDDSIPFPKRGDKFDHKAPLLWREASLAPVALFSTVHAHDEYLGNVKQSLAAIPNADRVGATSYYLPVPANSYPVESRSITSTFQIAYFGTSRIEHRAHKLLLALQSLPKSSYTFIWLLDGHEVPQAESLLIEFGISGKLVVERTPERWIQLLATTDIVAAPFFSVFGQCGAYLASSLMAGKPTLVTTFGGGESLPDEVVLKIQPGESEATEIVEALRLLFDDKAGLHLQQTVGAAAREFAVENYSAANVAEELIQIFEKTREHVGSVSKRFDSLREAARTALLLEAKSIVNSPNDPEAIAPWSRIIEPNLKEILERST